MTDKSKIEERYQALRFLRQIGWSGEDLSHFRKEDRIDYRVGSKVFLAFWQDALVSKEARELLQILLAMIHIPEDLSGQLSENQMILSYFHPDLAPDAPFWFSLAKLVDQAFPGDRLSHKGLLERQVHQLRYIISSQQAQYIRQHYKGAKESDGQALVTFLRKKKGPSFWPGSKDYSLGDSARLHNKLKIRDEEVFFPDNQVSYNIKVLVGFHTEFILDSFGNFLNEVDAEVLRENGVVNGASFNYGSRGKRHWDLDVDPVSQHDPLFRDEMTASYRSPKWLRKKWFWQADEEFLFSYFNPKGYYAKAGRSSFSHVKRLGRHYKWQIRFSKLKHFLRK